MPFQQAAGDSHSEAHLQGYVMECEELRTTLEGVFIIRLL